MGQGDAALIRLAGKTVLIDAGPSAAVASRLCEMGVDTVDLIVASHNHADHIGGVPAVLSTLPVRYYLDNGVPHTSRTYELVLALVRDRGITYLQSHHRVVALGDAMLHVAPSPAAREGEHNNSSVVVRLERGRFSALFTGDSETEQIQAMLEAGDVPDVDVLKAAHHGARNGVTPGWLARTRPEVVVISVGAGNSYGHPDPWALRYYEAGGRRVYRTDFHGDIIVRVAPDGSYTVTTTRGEP